MSSVTYKGAVYPWQCDHIGHMNVMWNVGKFDEANWSFFATLGLTPTYFAEQHRGIAAVQQNIAYKHELLAGNIVEVRSRALANWNFFATLGLTPTYFAEQHRGIAAVQQNIAYKHASSNLPTYHMTFM